MKSLSSVGLGLSVVFGCLLLALVAELYYLFWWKRRLSNREIGDGYKSPARELFYMFCLKRPASLGHSQELCSSIRITDALVPNDEESQLQFSASKDFLLKPFGDDPLETELMRLNSLSGPPRFLFTIVEETKEDLESEDGKSAKGSGGRSLSDLLLNVETPYLTPLASPPFFTPPMTPMDSGSYTPKMFNHLFESAEDAEFNKIRSSPPPKFKFLQDAEEKLYRRKMMEESGKKVHSDEEDGSFITVIVDRSKDRDINGQSKQHSSTPQVLPLASSPSRFIPADNKSSIHMAN